MGDPRRGVDPSLLVEKKVDEKSLVEQIERRLDLAIEKIKELIKAGTPVFQSTKKWDDGFKSNGGGTFETFTTFNPEDALVEQGERVFDSVNFNGKTQNRKKVERYKWEVPKNFILVDTLTAEQNKAGGGIGIVNKKKIRVYNDGAHVGSMDVSLDDDGNVHQEFPTDSVALMDLEVRLDKKLSDLDREIQSLLPEINKRTAEIVKPESKLD